MVADCAGFRWHTELGTQACCLVGGHWRQFVFGRPTEEAELAAAAEQWNDLGRTRAALVDGKLVGTAAMFSLELTVPGGGPTPMGAVTAVGMLPTHRRRGLLRAMMSELLADCRQRGESLAASSASEGSIYGRYGFGPATYQVRWELDRSAIRLPSRRWDARLELVDAEDALAAWPELHDRVRRSRVGEVSAYPGLWAERAKRTGGQQFVLHYGVEGNVDGAVIYRTPWAPDPESSGTSRRGLA